MAFLNYLQFARSSHRYHALDGLRSLAIFLVVLRHGLFVVPYYDILVQEPGSLLMQVLVFIGANGWTGVDLFFVLSGFLIGSQLLNFFESRQPLQAIWRFYVNRVFRIFPAYYAILLLIQFVLIRWPVFNFSVWFHNIPTTLLNHYLFLQDYTGPFLYPPLWSLGVEEKFYLVAPLLLWALYTWVYRHRSDRQLCSLVCLGALLLIPIIGRIFKYFASPEMTTQLYHDFRFCQLHLRCDGLIIGLFVAYLVKYYADHQWLKHPKAPGIFLGLGVLVTVMMWMLLPPDNVSHYSAPVMLFSGTGIALGYGLLVLGAVLLPNAKTGILGHRFLFFIATISYSLYLTHCLLTRLTLNAWFPWQYKFNLPIDLQVVGYLLFFFITTTLIATLFYWLIEKPFLLIKHKFSFNKNKE